MDRVHDCVAWYQKKIGSYDKHIWEQSAEQKVLRSIQLAPRRSVRQKTELIDVDLVRGSTFSRAKPQVSWTYITHKAITRVVFFPLYYKWWLQQMPLRVFVFLLVLYVMQIISLIIFFRNVGQSIMKDEQTLSEVVIPGLLMLILGQIHSQTVLSHLSHRSTHRDGKLARKSSTGLARESKSRNSRLSEVKRSFSVPSQVVGTIYENVTPCPVSENSPSKQTRSEMLASHQKTRSETLASAQKSRSETLASPQSDKAGDVKQNGSMDKPLNVIKTRSMIDRGRSGTNISEQKSVSWSDAYCVTTSHITGRESPDSDARTDEEDYQMEDKEISEKDLRSDEETEILKCSRKPINGAINLRSSPNDLGDKVARKDLSSEKHHKNVEKSTNLPIPETVVKSHMELNQNKKSESGDQFANVNGHIKDVYNVTEEIDRSLETCDLVTSDLLTSDLQTVSEDLAMINRKVLSEEHIPDLRLPDTTGSILILADGKPKGRHLNLKSDEPVNGRKCPELLISSCVSGSDDVFLASKGEDDKCDIVLNDDSDYSAPETESLCNSSHGSMDSNSVNRLISSPVVKSRRRSETGSDSDDLQNNKSSYKGLRRRKVNLTDDGLDSTAGFRSRRAPSSLSMKGRDSKGSTGISSSEGETSYTPDGSKAGASSEAEWEDRVQSDITTSTYSSSSASDNEMSENDTQDVTEDSPRNPTLPPSVSSSSSTGERTTKVASSLHVINLLQPPTSTTSVSPPPDKVSCVIWEDRECKKVELTALDIGWTIIEKVDNIPESSDYLWIGLSFSLFLGIVPLVFRLYHAKEYPDLVSIDGINRLYQLIISNSWRLNLIMVNGMIQRLCLGGIFFFLLSVADRTFKQRLLYAKHFCYLTSSRRAKKFDMPHFRLNKVRNIKIWLSLRSYLKKRGPQRSVDIIVSVTFLLTIIILTLMCLQLLKDTDTYLDFLCNWELLVWCMALGIYLLRFMTLGLKINKKYRNLSVLITEQINLYLQMEQKPHKKEELMVANNVLKLAEDLLKELESPFKISGVSANPVIYNVTKVVVLSAFSAVLTELLGFKMKLYKIKLRA